MSGRLVVAAPRSGGGKTTVTLGLMKALRAKGVSVQGFKVGPDYIDPGFHRVATGRPSYNLDPWMMGREATLESFRQASRPAVFSVIEGVMGLFDGRREDAAASTAEVAVLLDAPVVLVVDARGLGQSAAALVHGYARFDPRLRVAGVIFNRTGGENHRELLRRAVEEGAGVSVLGFLPADDSLCLPSRHLGLVQAGETGQLPEVLDRIAEAVTAGVDLEAVLRLGQGVSPLAGAVGVPSEPEAQVKIGVALDAAFSFYYQNALDLLAELGAELVFFSPLGDRGLPADLDAVYLGGGYPEVYARELEENQAFRLSLGAALRAGMPTYAECGGLIYLLEEMEDTDGNPHAGVGAIPGRAAWTGRRQALGYREARVLRDNPLAPAGTQVRGHEFHYSRWEPPRDAPSAYLLASGVEEGWASRNILASYLHVHLCAYPELARRFLRSARKFRGDRQWN